MPGTNDRVPQVQDRPLDNRSNATRTVLGVASLDQTATLRATRGWHLAGGKGSGRRAMNDEGRLARSS
eukprot:16032414-Heterocapsa_arctica.AAC.1